MLIQKHRASKGLNRPMIPRKFAPLSAEAMRDGLEATGLPREAAEAAASTAALAGPPTRGRKRTRAEDRGDVAMADGDEESDSEDGEGGGGRRGASASASQGPGKRVRSSSAVRAHKIALMTKYGGDERKAERARSVLSREPARLPAQRVGLKDEATRDRAVKAFGKYRAKKFDGRQGESDNRSYITNPKWMLSGKRGNGKTERR
jgi:hypothetical protein